MDKPTPWLSAHLLNSSVCPGCGTDQGTEGGNFNYGGDDNVVQRVKCVACNLQWDDVYQLSTCTVVEPDHPTYEQ